MKIVEHHSNGAKIEVTGSARVVKKTLEAWRNAQKPKEEEADEEPKVKGTGTIFLGSDDRKWEHDTYFDRNPIVNAKFGFVRNEENQ